MGIFNAFKQPDLPKPSSESTNPDIRYFEMVLRKWLDSPQRKEQFLAEKYYFELVLEKLLVYQEGCCV